MRTRICLLPALCILFCGCSTAGTSSAAEGSITDTMPLSYAEQFSVSHFADGCSLIEIGTDQFLLVPEGVAVPDHNGAVVIQQPVTQLYVAASASMDLFDAIGALDAIALTSTDTGGWTLPNVQKAMESGDLTFIGKYSSPDYEALLETDCDLAIENTMIYHSPAVKEKIESLGIPVMVERSSYEPHPLGRMEWIKLYGLLLGKEAEATAFFDEKAEQFSQMEQITIPEQDRLTAAFFSVTANGAINIRKPGDYISRMIGLAGGRYIFTAEQLHLDENALSTMNIQMETFYETARDADVLIYNSTIEGQLSSIEELKEKSSLFADFRAVQNDMVWCTEQNMFQQTTGAADMITDLNLIFTGQANDETALTYLHRLH